MSTVLVQISREEFERIEERLRPEDRFSLPSLDRAGIQNLIDPLTVWTESQKVWVFEKPA